MFLDNEATEEYYKIIEEANVKGRIKGDEYYEKHHIIPKSLGGSNDESNLVLLIPEEHYECHYLLTDMVEGEARAKMIFGWNIINSTRGINGEKMLGSKKYGELRRTLAKLMTGVNSVFAKEVYQLNKDTGKIIKKFGSVGDAKRETGLKTISDCCRGNYVHAGDYLWIYANEYNDSKALELVKAYKNGKIKNIYKLDIKTGLILKEYSNTTTAAKDIGVNQCNIAQCCRGYIKSAGGYLWIYAKDYTEEKANELVKIAYERKNKGKLYG